MCFGRGAAAQAACLGFGFGIKGSGFGIEGSGFRIEGLGLRV